MSKSPHWPAFVTDVTVLKSAFILLPFYFSRLESQRSLERSRTPTTCAGNLGSCDSYTAEPPQGGASGELRTDPSLTTASERKSEHGCHHTPGEGTEAEGQGSSWARMAHTSTCADSWPLGYRSHRESSHECTVNEDDLPRHAKWYTKKSS